jgi:hypothetical protein
MGKTHMLEALVCGHPECAKTRTFIRRGIVWFDSWGVKAIPVGKTPEYYMSWVDSYQQWRKTLATLPVAQPSPKELSLKELSSKKGL